MMTDYSHAFDLFYKRSKSIICILGNSKYIYVTQFISQHYSLLWCMYNVYISLPTIFERNVLKWRSSSKDVYILKTACVVVFTKIVHTAVGRILLNKILWVGLLTLLSVWLRVFVSVLSLLRTDQV